MKRTKFMIPGIILVAAIGFLGYQGFAQSAAYYYEVSEFVAQQGTFGSKTIRLSGTVADGTIERQPSSVRFTLTDGKESVPVAYAGVIPDAFKADAEAVVEGKLNPEGVFEAKTLLAKCPSKYEPEQPKE